MVRGLTEKLTSEQRPEVGQEMRHVDTWRERILERKEHAWSIEGLAGSPVSFSGLRKEGCVGEEASWYKIFQIKWKF